MSCDVVKRVRFGSMLIARDVGYYSLVYRESRLRGKEEECDHLQILIQIVRQIKLLF